MYIKNVYIHSFGTLRNFSAEFSRGLNIIEGENESGKTAIAMFIKFIFYGLSGRATDADISERKRFVNWDTGEASGSLSVSTENGDYRIERRLYVSTRSEDTTKETARESVKIVDESNNMPISTSLSPGMFFLGVGEEVFVNTVFVRQLSGTKVNGTDVQAAMENILYSADENVNTEKAIEKLDKIRKNLLHKNGNGGEIYELHTMKERLTAELKDAQSRGTETIKTEASLDETQKKIAQLEENRKQLDEILSAYETVVLDRKHKTRLAAERKLADLEATMDKLSASPASAEYSKDISSTYDDLTAASEAIGSIEMEIEDINYTLEDYEAIVLEDDPERDTLSDYAEKLTSQKRAFTLTSVFLYLIALLTGVVSALSYFVMDPPILSFNTTVIVAGVAAMAFLSAIVFTVSAINANSKLNVILRDWNCDEAGGIQKALNEFNKKADEKRAMLAELNELNEALVDARSSKKILLQRLNTICSSLDVPISENVKTMTEVALEVCADITAKKNGARSEYEAIKARLEEIRRQLADVDVIELEYQYDKLSSTEAGRRALALSVAEVEEIKKKLAFVKEAHRANEERKHNLELSLTELRASLPDPAKISAELSDTSGRLATLEKSYEAYMLAINSLETATENLRSGVLPRLTSRSCSIMEKLSAGAYHTVGVGQSLDMSFSKFGMTRAIEYLSAGTRDLAYLSLRVSLIEVLFKDGTPTAIFDESFARIDENRLAAIMKYLSGEDAFQSLVFTCREAESKLSENLAGVNKIKISRSALL